jgi:hypothetical protein
MHCEGCYTHHRPHLFYCELFHCVWCIWLLFVRSLFTSAEQWRGQHLDPVFVDIQSPFSISGITHHCCHQLWYTLWPYFRCNSSLTAYGCSYRGPKNSTWSSTQQHRRVHFTEEQATASCHENTIAIHQAQQHSTSKPANVTFWWEQLKECLDGLSTYIHNSIQPSMSSTRK